MFRSSSHVIDSRPTPLLLSPAHGPSYGVALSLRYVFGYGAPSSMSSEHRRWMPYFTSEQVTGEPSCQRRFGFSVNSHTVLFSLGRPMSVARSPTISLAA